MAKPQGLPPATSLDLALARSEPLTGLMQRMRASQGRLASISGLLPAGLLDGVRAGPLDDASWVLLVAHSAGAAKLRQLMPDLQAALVTQGWPELPIKIKVLPRA